MRIQTYRAIAITLFLCLVRAGVAAAQARETAKPSKPQPVKATVPRTGITEDQARLIVKEIPSVDVQRTLARWKFDEPELAKLRRWSSLLIEEPAAAGFQTRWSEFVTGVKIRKLALQSQDVANLIQMTMSAAYEEANKNVEPAREKIQLLRELKGRVQENLTETHRMQALLRSHQLDALSGSLLPLPPNQRTLRKCQLSATSPVRLDCQEVMVSTTMELEAFVSQTEEQISSTESATQKAAEELEKVQQKRLQMLLALSETARMMYNTAVPVLQIP